MTEIQQKIYNDYLKALAEVNNRPYRFRKDFSKLDDAILIVLHRLELFFTQYKHISPYQFFKASLEYKELKYLPLSDYIKHGAVVAYSKWNKAKYDNFVEDERAVDDFMKGLKFIHDFCVAENITLKEYRTKTNNVGVHYMLIHLNEQKISFYHLHALDMSKSQFDSDYLHLTFNDFNETFDKTKRQYINSKLIKQISNKLNKQ